MNAKEHYDNHLGKVYSWMVGDFEGQREQFKAFLLEQGLTPQASKNAVDLGAGHGVQSVALAEVGYRVLAVDFNRQLLAELRANAKDREVATYMGDIRDIKKFSCDKPELILCWRDTLLHLNNKQEVEALIADVSEVLNDGGKAVFSFRDYSTPLRGTDRFINVRSDDHRILTCVLDFEADFVAVTDVLYEKRNGAWTQKVSAYRKVRLLPADVIGLLASNRLTVTFNETVKGLTTIIAQKALN